MFKFLDRITQRKKIPDLSSVKRILVLRPDRLGDVLLTFPAVYNLCKAFPAAEIYYCCRAYTSPIVRCYTPVKGIIEFPEGNDPKRIRGVSEDIRRLKFDLAVHLLPKASLARATFQAGIPYRLGMGYRLYSVYFNLRQFEHRKYNDFHEAEYNLRMLRLLGIPTAYDERTYQQFKFPAAAEVKTSSLIKKKFGGGKYILIHPGSGGSSLDWPLENYKSLIKRIMTLPGIGIGITGIESERDRLKPILTSGLAIEDLTGQLDMVQLALLLKQAALFISNSTGPLHLAVAMGTSVLGFYPAAFDLGAKRWGPFMRDAKQVITPNDHLPFEMRPSSNLDMTKITAENAFLRIKMLLNIA
jgi:heptosyltransferase-3